MTDAQTKLELHRLRGLSDTEVIHEAEDTPIGQHPIVIVLIERFKVQPQRKPCKMCKGSGRMTHPDCMTSECTIQCPECKGEGLDLT